MAKRPMKSATKNIPMAVEHMISATGDPEFREKAMQFWADPHRASRYDERFSALLASLPADELPRLAEACERYIRSWGSGGGSYRVETSVVDAATTDFPRVLAVNIFRELKAINMDVTEAYCLVVSIFEDAMEEVGAIWTSGAA